MKFPSSDLVRNVLAVISLIVSLGALVVSGYTFRYQYVDHTDAHAKVTQFLIHGRVLTDAVGDTLKEATGSVALTIFNPGNRAIYIDTVQLYLQPGDYETLLANQTPPCTFRIGSRYLNSKSYEDFKKPTSDFNSIDAQHILSIPITFPAFLPTDTSTNVAQGTICLKIISYGYTGKSSNIEFPVGIVRIVREVPFRRPLVPFNYAPPRGTNVQDIHPLF